MQRFINDEIVILRKFPINESDLLLVVLSKHHGKLLLKVKGERKINSQFKGKINIFNHLSTQIYNSSRTLTLTEANLLNCGPDGTNLKSFSQSQDICKIINSILPDNTPTPEIFDLLVEVIQNINSQDTDQIHMYFLTKFLQIEGYLSPIIPPENLHKISNLNFTVTESGSIIPTTEKHFDNPFLFGINTIKAVNFFLKNNLPTCQKLKISEQDQENIYTCLKQIFQNSFHTKLNSETKLQLQN